MLKGKKSIYILVPLNVFIWGYMAYKIYAAMHEDGETGAAKSFMPQLKVKPEDSVAYTLKLNYKDPFLKQEIKPRRSVQVSEHNMPRPHAAKPKAAPVVEPKPAPDIKYVGMIENKANGSVAAMVSVNGSSQIIKPGQAIGEILFQSFTQDYLTVKIGKEKLTIKK